MPTWIIWLALQMANVWRFVNLSDLAIVAAVVCIAAGLLFTSGPLLCVGAFCLWLGGWRLKKTGNPSK